MKNFKLLLKNSMKSLWNSRGLVTQFTILTTIATTVLSSVFLGNFSLRNAISDVKSKSNANGFSIEDNKIKDFASYNIINESNKLVKSLDELTMNDAVGETKIYNPLMKSTTLNVDGKPYTTYGFFGRYKNEYEPGKFYVDTPEAKTWNNIVFSKNNEALPIITDNLDPSVYKNQITDLFTIYNDILPPSPRDVLLTNYQTFFDPNIYSFNPWTLTYKDINNQMLYANNYGIGILENFQNEYKEEIIYNHGVFDEMYSFVIGTDKSFLGKEQMENYATEVNAINKKVQFAPQLLNYFSNDWKQMSWINNFNNIQEFDKLNWEFRLYNDNYWNFLNYLSTDIRNNFMVPSKYFSFKYSMNPENSIGISKFFSDMYLNEENELHNEFNNIFNQNEMKYFEGTISVPIIPFITVLPKTDSNTKLSPEQYRDWATNFFLDETKTIPNVDGIKSVMNYTFNLLSKETNKFLSNRLNESRVSSEVRNKYYSEYNIEYFINNELELDFSKSSDFVITDSKQNSFIFSKTKYYTETKVNDVVVSDGRGVFDNRIDENYVALPKEVNTLVIEWRNTIASQTDDIIKNKFLNENYFWTFIEILSQLKLNTNKTISDEFYELVNIVSDFKIFNNDFNKWKQAALDFLYIYDCSLISWNGAGYNVEFTRKNKLGITIDFSAVYYEPSSHTSVVGLNYSQLKNGSKQIIDTSFVEKAVKLPFKQKRITNDDVINNYKKYKDHFIYNPYTKKEEFYNDFLDWLNKIEDRFKLNINGDEFVIIGSGISSEFVYPIVSSNQLLINNNAPVIFTNELGFDKMANNNTVKPESNYFVNFHNSFNVAGNASTLSKVNEWTQRVSNQKLAYYLSDSSQPNNLLYLRMNFPYTILSTVLTITVSIASIVVLLAFVFIYVLMKSIVNQNMNTFAVGMANGISKRKLLFSFMPFVLIPAAVSAILGYSLSFFLYPVISNSIQNYWILEYIKFPFNPGYLILVFLIITLIIFTVQSTVVYIMLNKNVSNLLNAKMEFRYNKLVQHSHKLVSKLSPLASFRITYMLGNFGRFVLLLLMMTSFVSLTTISASTLNTFNTAMQKTMDNKEYNYAIDLLSPTEQGGYYYDIPYNLLGTRQKGLVPLHDLNKSTGFYNKDYKEVLSYNVPNQNETLVYDNMFLPQAGLIGDVLGDIIFFRNKIVHLLAMDFGINFVGSYINPWEWAKKILPGSIVSLVENNLQQQINYAFLYTCWLNKNKINNGEKNMWLYNVDEQTNFLSDLNNSTNPDYWNQSNWLIQLIKEDGNYFWKPNEQYLSNGLPNFTITKPFTNLITRIVSFENNPYYQQFIKEFEKKQNKKVIDSNFMLALNVIPIIPQLDETYTYINATSDLNKKMKTFDFKITGIKPNSTQVLLWNEYSQQDLKSELVNYEIVDDVYPLIINEVVHKKYNLDVKDEIEIIVNNKYNRYTTKFENKPNLDKYKFEIIGIATSKSEEQYFTTQEIANKLLGFKKPELATEFDLRNKNYDYKWVSQQDIDQFIPFNGVFSKQALPKMLANFATLYSTSGMAPIGGTLPVSYNGDSYGQILRNYSEINKILKFNIVDETKPRVFENIMQFKSDYIKTFGNDKYYSPAIANIDAKFASELLGQTIDNTLWDVNLVCIISLVPAILIIIVLMSYMIVVESRRLVALLKVLGFSDWTNTITLSTVQFVVVGLALLIGYGFSYIMLEIMKVFAFKFLSIIINPIIPIWTLGLTLGVLALIVTIITFTIFINLRKTNPAQEIAVR